MIKNKELDKVIADFYREQVRVRLTIALLSLGLGLVMGYTIAQFLP